MFLFSGISCGIKKNSKKDFALAVLPKNTSVIGFFTSNNLKSEVIARAEKILKSKKRARVIAVVSGNAMCRYKGVEKDAEKIVKQIKKVFQEKTQEKISEDEIILLATGKIGVKLETEKIIDKVKEAFEKLSENESDFSSAIITTDKVEKVVKYQNGKFFVLGIAKGAGMIFPKFSATTLSFIFTNSTFPKGFEKKLYEVISETIGAVNIDHSTSTNDSCIISFGNEIKTDEKNLEKAIRYVLSYLAVKIAEDGEGVSHVVKVEVKGAKDNLSARKICEYISGSMLLKCSLAGESPDFGRILAAIGSSNEKIGKIKIFLRSDFSFHSYREKSKSKEKLKVVENSKIIEFDTKKAKDIMKNSKYTIEIQVGNGKGKFQMLMTDLTEEYVKINLTL